MVALTLKGSTILLTGVFLVWLLLSCGDVESNPGPGSGRRTPVDNWSEYDHRYYSQHSPSPLERLHTDMAMALNQAVDRLEKSSQQQARSIENRLKKVDEKIDIRLQHLENDHLKLSAEIQKLQSQCQSLRENNEDLNDDITRLTNKCEFWENQHRRNNLIFVGLAPNSYTAETWEESETRVREAIREGIGIEENIHIEHVHRSGRAIVVQLLSYRQKMKILSRARNLKDSADFGNVFVREDFSDSVQKKRKGLRQTQRELRSKGQSAWLRFDKLVTRDATYTYDPEEDTVRKWDRRRGPVRGNRPWEENEYKKACKGGESTVSIGNTDKESMAMTSRMATDDKIRNQEEKAAFNTGPDEEDVITADTVPNSATERNWEQQDDVNSTPDQQPSFDEENISMQRRNTYNLRPRNDDDSRGVTQHPCAYTSQNQRTGQSPRVGEHSRDGRRQTSVTSGMSNKTGRRESSSQQRIDHMLRSSRTTRQPSEETIDSTQPNADPRSPETQDPGDNDTWL